MERTVVETHLGALIESVAMSEQFTLDFETEEPPESTLIVAFPESGLAGLSANHYLIERLGLVETGHIQAEGVPAITPYEDGQPYHHTRLFSKDGFGYTVLTCELPIPIQLSEPFGRMLIRWIEERAVEEVTLLTTIPSLEMIDQLFYVASEDYVETRLTDEAITPLGGGFLTGVNASLIARAIDTSLRVGVLAAPGNPFVPVDGGTTLQLVEGLNSIYELDIDTTQLEQFATESSQYYRELTAQIEAQQQAQAQRSMTDDYGYM